MATRPSTTPSRPADTAIRAPALLTACLALVSVNASLASTGLALPVIAAEVGAGQTELGWIAGAFGVALAGALLPAGRGADRFGRRRVLILGLLTFGIANVVLPLAGTPVPVIGLQVLAGLGAAAVLPTALTVLVDAFPASRRSTAVSVWAVTTSLSATVGALTGSALTDRVGWWAMPLALGLLALGLVLPAGRTVRDAPDPGVRVDPWNALLVLVGLGALVLGVGQAGAGIADPVTLGALAVAVVALLAVGRLQRRGAAAIVPRGRPGDRSVLAGLALLVLAFGAFSVPTFLGPQYLQGVLGLSTLGSAVALLPNDVGLLLAAPVLPWALGRFGARWVGAAGAAGGALALVVLAVAVPGPSPLPAVAALVLFGAGVTATLTSATALVLSGVATDRPASGSALNDVGRQVGPALGAVALGAVALGAYRSELDGVTGALPPEQGDRVAAGLAEARAVATELGPAGTDLLTAAGDAFARSVQVGLVAAGAVALLGAVLCAVLAPSGATDVPEEVPDTTAARPTGGQ
ncbi:MFS transporter [Pseudonocardia sp. DR1-2]|uniref:MFS transporter n=1 Tax=Pseudonocardia sp. DR1-2 TaxID=2951168 RepID=UPI002042E65E|nr:MFS transporter [Pseudonocardia sp. DR1-2]MCM3849669.1 MFS transporter [Pseudonocardia sp. DR1-2]